MRVGVYAEAIIGAALSAHQMTSTEASAGAGAKANEETGTAAGMGVKTAVEGDNSGWFNGKDVATAAAHSHWPMLALCRIQIACACSSHRHACGTRIGIASSVQ